MTTPQQPESPEPLYEVRWWYSAPGSMRFRRRESAEELMAELVKGDAFRNVCIVEVPR